MTAADEDQYAEKCAEFSEAYAKGAQKLFMMQMAADFAIGVIGNAAIIYLSPGLSAPGKMVQPSALPLPGRPTVTVPVRPPVPVSRPPTTMRPGSGLPPSANPKAEGLNIQWRGYLFWYLQLEIELTAKLSREACFAFRRAFVKSVTRSAWGAISAAAINHLLNSVELTVPRIEGVLRHWDALDTLRYIDFGERPISLTQFMTYHFHGNVAMWVDQPTGELRTDLATAITQMRKASDEEVYQRLVKRLREYVDIRNNFKHPEWLKSPGVIEARLQVHRHEGQEFYDDLTSGYWPEHGKFLAWLDQDYGPGSERFDPSFGKKP